MQKQDGHDQLNGKGKSASQETIVSDEAALGQRHYKKKLLPNLLVTFYIYKDGFG